MKTSYYKRELGLMHPLRAVVVADLHSRPTEKLYSEIQKQCPDLILLPGDIFDCRGKSRKTVMFLNNISKTAPVFCSLGNHDRLMTEEERSALENDRITLLDNSQAEFCGLTICGLTSGFFKEYRSDVEKTPPPELDHLERFAHLPSPRLLLCHHPEYYPDYIKATNIELTVSGHAHGGQWRIFGRGVFAPGQGLFPKYTEGAHDNVRLIISRGVTNTVKVPRFFNPTELVVIDCF